jgi:uncharacterized protein
MRKAATAALGACLGLAPLLASPAQAASFNCRARGLTSAEAAICQDKDLSRTDDQLFRKLNGFTRRLTFGQYLGLRVWHGDWRLQRNGCGPDRACLAGSYRTQGRVLDRLQQCLDTSLQRRLCLRSALNIEREARSGATRP